MEKETNNYYIIKKRINLIINEKVNKARKEQKDLDINKLIYSLTLEYPISEKAVINRLKLIQSIEKDFDISPLNVLEWRSNGNN